MSLRLVFQRLVCPGPGNWFPPTKVTYLANTRTVSSDERLTVADLERSLSQMDRKIREIERDNNYPKKVATSPLHEYVSAMRLNSRSTVGLGSERAKMYQELYKQWHKEFRQLPKVEKQIYTAKSKEKRDKYKLQKDEWDRTYSGSNLALELDGLRKQRALTKAKLTRLIKNVL